MKKDLFNEIQWNQAAQCENKKWRSTAEQVSFPLSQLKHNQTPPNALFVQTKWATLLYISARTGITASVKSEII